LDDNYIVIDNLEKERVELSDELEQKIAYYEAELEKLKALNRQEVAALEATVQDQEEELFSLKEYKESKIELEANMKTLSESLQNEKKARQNDIDLLERKMFHEKERIKKEFLIKIKETKQNLLSMTEDQLHTTTKRTIMENEQMTTELQYQSRETERLLKLNTRLRSENKELKRNVGLTEEAGKEYAKKTYFYQKLIKKLHEKIQDQTSAMEENESSRNSSRSTSRSTSRGKSKMDGNSMVAGRSGRRSSNNDSNSSNKAQEKVIRSLRDKVESLELNLNQVCNELDATRRQLHRVSNQGSNDPRTLIEFLMVALNDAKAEALLLEDGEDLNASMEPSIFPPSLRVGMITKLLQLIQQGTNDGSINGGSQISEEFSRLFNGDLNESMTKDTVSWNQQQEEQKKVETCSIAIQTDNVDPITVLKNVDVGPMSRSSFSFFTDNDGGTQNDLDNNGGSINMSESATSRFLRGPVRGWGAPTVTYGMPKVSGPKTFRKRRTGLGATGKSVLTM